MSQITAKLKRRLSTKAGMEHWLDRLYGTGNWRYDEDEDVWVVDWNHAVSGTSQQRHRGPGRAYLIVRRGGDWFKAVLPEALS